MSRWVTTALALLFATSLAASQSQPTSSPQALVFAAQSIAALTGGTTVRDVTLTGTVTWNGAGGDTGTATLRALGTSESRMDLVLSSGTHTEIRDAQTGTPLGRWINPNNASGQYASQNCWTDAVWFFPALGSLTASANIVLSYVGQESRNGSAVQHIESYVYQSAQLPSPNPQQLSTMDFYLDATSLLPVAVTLNSHPDNNATVNLVVEVDFSNYQAVNGILVPFHIQKYLNGQIIVDMSVTSAVFNSGLPLSDFSVQ